jgi:hypothetical protein
MNNLNNQTPGMSLHQVFSELYKFKYIILTTSLVLWSIIPILGIFFLLLYCQINISGNKIKDKNITFANVIPIILVLFTIITYNASITPIGDTDAYIKFYKSLNFGPLFNISDPFNKEPVSFILPQLVSKLTNGDEFSFLLLQSATINTLLTIYSKIFVPEFYPIIMIINIFSNGYYFQLFWMRQFYSFLFLIPSVFINSSILLNSLLIYISFLTHNASGIFFIPLFVEKISNTIKQKFRFQINKIQPSSMKIIMITIFIIILFMTKFLVEPVISIMGNQEQFYGKINDYSGAAAAEFTQTFSLASQLRPFFDYVMIIIFIFNSDFSKINSIYFRWLLVFLMMIFFQFAVYTVGFNGRISALFYCLPGFFYNIPIYSGKLDGSINIYTYMILLSLVLRIIYFTGSIVISYENPYLTFLNRETLTTITGYLDFLLTR